VTDWPREAGRASSVRLQSDLFVTQKQGKLMKAARSLSNPQILGRMYWTTTGMSESIHKRDSKMWSPPNVAKLHTLWNQGLGEYLESSIPLDYPEESPLLGHDRKRFMPNIIMVDFADDFKCRTIYDLNTASPDTLARLDEI
jgi:hypothetical protein